jgi:hypothetical protein
MFILNPAMLRRFNPTPTQWALITTAGVAALVIGVGAVMAGPSPKGPPPQVCDPTPYVFDPAEVTAAINTEIDNGDHDKANVAMSVATLLYGQHPSGQTVFFPPVANPLPGVACVWQLTVAMVDAVFEDRGIIEGPTGPSTSLDWVLHNANDPGYPWEEPTLQTSNFPTPGTFVDIGNASGSWKPSHGYDSMVRAYLGSGLAMAGGDVTLATSGAGQELRKQVRQAIMAVGGFNDLLYGQTNLNYAGGNDPNKPGGDPNKPVMASYVLNEQGRGLNWLPRHKDNLHRIPQGDAPKRATRLDGSKLGGANAGSSQMLVWLPALDLDALAQPVPSVEFLTWSDGSSTLDPPPAIKALGIDMSGVVLPGVAPNQGAPGPGIVPPLNIPAFKP